MVTAPVVALRGVGRTYPGPPTVSALHPTDLSVREGEWISITGPSGSGKSTLLHLLGLLDRPTSGIYELAGLDTTDLTDAAVTRIRGDQIGFVFQAFHLLQHRTALENVALALLYGPSARRQRNRRATEALRRVGLAHRLHALPTALSGGEQQRVAIARALVTEPKFLLADEPTGNLDSATAAGVLDLFSQLSADGQTIVVVTHDETVAARAGRRVSLRDGRLVQDDA
jgi:putative ABC transport system ATP-binding protein